MASSPEKRKELYHKHIAEGRCISCYERATGSSLYCERHREMSRVRNQRSNEAARKRYKEENRCSRCGVPLDDREGKVTCINCGSAMRESMTRRGRNLCKE